MKLRWQENGRNLERVISRDMPVIIGRSFECDIVLTDPYVSRHHAVAGYEDGDLVLRSMNNRNPITVNGALQLRSGETCILREGDAFTVGQVKLKTSLPTQSANLNKSRTKELKLICPTCQASNTNATINCEICGENLFD